MVIVYAARVASLVLFLSAAGSLCGCRNLFPYRGATRDDVGTGPSDAAGGRDGAAQDRAANLEARSGREVGLEVGPPKDSGGADRQRTDGGGGPTFLHSAHVGGTGEDQTTAVAVDSSGNLLMAGSFTSPAEVYHGGSAVAALSGAQGTDIFVVSFSSSGSLNWSRSFGGTGDDLALAMTVDSSGNVYVAGSFEGTVQFDSFTLKSAGSGTTASKDAFVAKLDPSGTVKKAYAFGGDGDEEARGVVVDPSGNLFVAGSYSKGFSLGSSTTSCLGGTDVFLAKIDTGGNIKGNVLSGSGDDTVAGLVTDGTYLYLAGSFASAGFPASSGVLSAKGVDGYLVLLDTQLAVHWIGALGGTATDTASAVAVNSNLVCAGGSFASTGGNFANTVLSAVAGTDGWVACYQHAGTAMSALGARAFSTSSTCTYTTCASGIDALALDAKGALFVGGHFVGSMNLGGGALSSGSGEAASFLAAYDTSSKMSYLFGKQYGDAAAADRPLAVALDPAGTTLAVCGLFFGDADFGGGLFSGHGSGDGWAVFYTL